VKVIETPEVTPMKVIETRKAPPRSPSE